MWLYLSVSPRFPSETDAWRPGGAPPLRPFGPTLPEGESEERRNHALSWKLLDRQTDVEETAPQERRPPDELIANPTIEVPQQTDA